MVSKTYSMGLYGMEAFLVEVEAFLSQGLPAFELVGLPDAAVKESRDRVRAALKNCGFDFPVSRITMNLAPADKRKEGPIYDLPLLISLLKASRQLDCPTDDAIFLGELSLSGELRPIRGVLPMADKAREAGFKRLYVPAENAGEGAVIRELQVYPVRDVPQLMAHLLGKLEIPPATPSIGGPEAPEPPGLRRCKGPARGQTGPGDRRQWRPQCAAHRAARLRQEHVGKTAALHPPGDDFRGGPWRPPRSTPFGESFPRGSP